ncbi:tetratricopeptide repeat protein [Leptolyngbya sp. AN03gr2]|uniref:tetratricopeptide repeat protein n=1 Tax=unclassified Leptolyngbya TaxID=2650499 RepID=UPI003D318F20
MQEVYYKSAIANFSKAVNKDKQCTIGFYARGCSFMKLRALDHAVHDFNQVIALDSSHNEAYQKRADILYSQANYKGAIADYTTLSQLGIHSGENYFKRGMAFAAINRIEDALADFSRAIEVCSIYSLSYLARGNIYLLKGKLEEAFQDFNQAIKLNDNYPEGYLGRARVCHALKKYRNAVSDYSKALGLSRGSSDRDIRRSAYHGRCLSYLALKQPWNARWDSLRAGIWVKGLRLTQQEVIYAATPVLAVSALFAAMPFMVDRILLKPNQQAVSALASKSGVEFDGGSFSGESANGKANGKGVWTHSNGSKLEGEFRENVLTTGRGVLHDSNSRYEGSFANGKKNGQGILQFADGTVYEGTFKDGEPYGEGVTIFLDRTQYKGEHRGNQFHGKGVLMLPTGERWKGEFANSKLSGKVTKTSPSGEVEEQVCVNGDCTKIPAVSSKSSAKATNIRNQSNSKQ